jgi:hypothetical protein
MNPFRILIADDHAMIRDGLKNLIILSGIHRYRGGYMRRRGTFALQVVKAGSIDPRHLHAGY